jgi:hypothetical protein
MSKTGIHLLIVAIGVPSKDGAFLPSEDKYGMAFLYHSGM